MFKFKKVHVGIFISDFMEALEITDSALSRMSGVSRDHIINLKNGKVDLNAKTAISLAPFLQVDAEMLMALQVSYTQFLENEETKAINKKVYSSITDAMESLLANCHMSKKTYDLFASNQEQYCRDFQIVHYKPNSANLYKNYLLIESLNAFGNNSNKLDLPELSSYLDGEFSNDLVNVMDPAKAKEFLLGVRRKLYSLGIHVKFINTGLKTTIKGISKRSSSNVNVLIENNGEFSKIIWYLVHELSHLFVDDSISDQKIIEDTVNSTTSKILLKDLDGYLSDIEESELNKINCVNKYILNSCWTYVNKKFTSNTTDLILEECNDFYTQLQ